MGITWVREEHFDPSDTHTSRMWLQKITHTQMPQRVSWKVTLSVDKMSDSIGFC